MTLSQRLGMTSSRALALKHNAGQYCTHTEFDQDNSLHPQTIQYFHLFYLNTLAVK